MIPSKPYIVRTSKIITPLKSSHPPVMCMSNKIITSIMGYIANTCNVSENKNFIMLASPSSLTLSMLGCSVS